jgi:hypothetical protein
MAQQLGMPIHLSQLTITDTQLKYKTLNILTREKKYKNLSLHHNHAREGAEEEQWPNPAVNEIVRHKSGLA